MMRILFFRDDPHDIFAGIGTNVLPSASGVAAAARFENHNDTGWSSNTNLASYFSAKNGGKNYAIYIGAGVIGGFAVSVQQLGDNHFDGSGYFTPSNGFPACT
jgi:hypothetical protein